MDQKGSGLHLRTFSRAFIIDDGVERFVFVSVDSAMIGNDIRQEVILNYIHTILRREILFLCWFYKCRIKKSNIFLAIFTSRT